ncbi:MAG: T9SS type A sorting domain-containing protein, partial [Chitinophagaceae bacterium]
VQRSANGVSFLTIGKINGAGNSSQTIRYEFIDAKPLEGRNYYRLRQVDFDNKFAISVIVSENMQSQYSVSIYPNPFSEQLFVQYPKATKGSGYKVLAIDGHVTKSGNLSENSTQMKINLEGLKSGNYILIIYNNGKQYHQRIVKQ